MRTTFIALSAIFFLNVSGADASFLRDFVNTIKTKIFGSEKDSSQEKLDDQIEKEDQEILKEEETQKDAESQNYPEIRDEKKIKEIQEENKKQEPATEEKVTSEKTTDEKPAEEKTTEGKATNEKTTDEKATEAKTTEEKVTSEKAVEEKVTEQKENKPETVEKKVTFKSTTNQNPCFNASNGFADVVEKVLPGVVNVATTQVVGDKEDQQADLPPMPGMQGSPFEDLFRKFLEQQQGKPRKIHAVGSGFIIHEDEQNYYIATNHHVVQDTKKIKLIMSDKTEVEALFHSGDERTDIAVIQLPKENLPQDKKKLTVLEWAIGNKSRVGDWVIAIGNSFGFGSSVTVGVLSHKGRDMVSRASNGRLSDYIDDYIQHSAQINFGNSGGCLLDTSGKVIGMNTAIISPSGGNVGIGFAIPVHVAMKTVKQLIEHGRTKRGWLGVKIQPFTEEMAESIGHKNLANKPIVVSVTPDGPAEKAGIEERDIIIAYNGKKLDDSVRLSRLVGETEVGKSVPLTVWRKNKEVTVNVLLGEYEDAEQKGQLDDNTTKKGNKKEKDKVQEILGISFSALTNQLKERLRIQDKNIKGGIVVLKVDPSKVMEIPLMRGDVIIEANQVSLETPQTFIDVVEEAKKKGHKNLLLLMTRNESEPHYITIKISEDENDDADNDSNAKTETPTEAKKESKENNKKEQNK